ncbi:PREDICTED: uncharacterized protein LOC106816323 [Priapulus caudatus]|uniref:Uncharacterized protein LOC106816323 n=1 Tax=Priapulus caudatus TaxID=37621 RepID=A0ABM1EW20_PRICU|nr:PREDICTED: uncharacterized protein LOC106816323 [Priapulus caudatus]
MGAGQLGRFSAATTALSNVSSIGKESNEGSVSGVEPIMESGSETAISSERIISAVETLVGSAVESSEKRFQESVDHDFRRRDLNRSTHVTCHLPASQLTKLSGSGISVRSECGTPSSKRRFARQECELLFDVTDVQPGGCFLECLTEAKSTR